MRLRDQLEIFGLRLEDYLRTRGASAAVSAVRSPLAYLPIEERRQLDVATEVAAHFPANRFGRLMLRRARALARNVARHGPTVERASVGRSAIIKPYVSDTEPGYLLVSFESELGKIARLRRLNEFESKYRIIFLPTWQPFYSKELGLYEARSTKPFYLMPSAFGERELCGEFSRRCRYLPFHAASWVLARDYEGLAQQKSIDLLMIANFSRHKRHWKLFEALATLPRDLRVVVAGVPLQGRTAESLKHEASLFGVRERVTIIENCSDSELRDLVGRARLFCAMTHKEGSYIAVAEALIAGTPVAMFGNAKIGTKTYVNEQTGFLLDPSRPLASQLMDALLRSDGLSPRQWARAHICAEHNASVLNDLLRESAEKDQLDWSADIEPFYCRRFEFIYARQEAERRLATEYIKLSELCGIDVQRPSPVGGAN